MVLLTILLLIINSAVLVEKHFGAFLFGGKAKKTTLITQVGVPWHKVFQTRLHDKLAF